MSNPDFWVYILSCKNHSFYTGYTKNLILRYRAHIQGKAAKYTRSFPPQFLAWSWPIYGDKATAMKIENFIKKMNTKHKQNLVKNPNILENLIIEHYTQNE
jgi:putative endonuclease